MFYHKKCMTALTINLSWRRFNGRKMPMVWNDYPLVTYEESVGYGLISPVSESLVGGKRKE